MSSKIEIYKKRAIKTLTFGKSLTALEISYKIDKSLPLTNNILSELVKEGLLKETGLASSTGGRRPATYSLAPEKIYVLSVSMDQYVTKVSHIDLSSRQILNLKKYDLALSANENAAERLGDILAEYLKEEKLSGKNFLGVGIAMPGLVDVKKGINFTHLPVPKGENGSLVNFLEKRINIPVAIDNDSSVIALAEQILGLAQDKTNSLVINFGWGVGLGMIVDGRLFRGSNGVAGEFSHIPLFDNNKLCSCGKSGCLETETSLLTVIDGYKAALRSGVASHIKQLPENLEEALDSIIDAVNSGEQLAIELFTKAAYEIGRGIAILIHIFNPEQIIISGRGAVVGPVILAPIQQAISKFCIPRLASYTSIQLSKLNKDTEIYGAAALATDNMIRRKSEPTKTSFSKAV